MVFDSFLCWPRTKAGEKVWQKCPEGVRGLDSQSKHLHFGILIYLCMHHSSFRIGLSPMFIGRHLVFLPRSQHQSRPRLDQLQPLLDGLDAQNHGRFESNSQLSQCSIRWRQLRRSKSFFQRESRCIFAIWVGYILKFFVIFVAARVISCSPPDAPCFTVKKFWIAQCKKMRLFW